MTFGIHIPLQDPYIGLFRLQGGKSQVLCHGDDLGGDASTVGTWGARHGGLTGTAGGSPTVNGTGWAGSGGATFKTMLLDASTEHMAFDAEAANYDATTAFTWIIAAKFTASPVGRNALFLGSSSSGVNYRGFTTNVTNDFAYLSSNRNGSTEFDAGTAITESAQGIWVVSLSGGNAIIKQGLAGGITTLLSTTHTMTGTLTVNKFVLGALFAGGSAVGYTPGDYRFISCYRGAGLDTAGCDRVINYVRYNLRCPL